MHTHIKDFLEEQKKKQTLRFITCGSVDDGKSTLIGRMLHESKNLFDDQLQALENDSRQYGTQGEKLDFALLVDGLQADPVLAGRGRVHLEEADVVIHVVRGNRHWEG